MGSRFSVWLLPGTVTSTRARAHLLTTVPQHLAHSSRPSDNVHPLPESEQLHSREKFGWNSSGSRLDPKAKSAERQRTEPSVLGQSLPRMGSTLGTGPALDYLVTTGGRLGLMCPRGMERGV